MRFDFDENWDCRIVEGKMKLWRDIRREGKPTMGTKAEVEFEGYNVHEPGYTYPRQKANIRLGNSVIPGIECFSGGYFKKALDAMTEGLQHLDKYQLPPPRLTKEEKAVLSACIAYCRCNCWETSSKLSNAAFDYTLSVKK